MENVYEFSAYNTETQYGFGTESEATVWLEFLNSNREINLFEMCVSSLSDAETEDKAFNLAEALRELD